MNNNIHGIKYGSGVKKEAEAGAGSGRREEGTSGRRDPRPLSGQGLSPPLQKAVGLLQDFCRCLYANDPFCIYWTEGVRSKVTTERRGGVRRFRTCR